MSLTRHNSFKGAYDTQPQRSTFTTRYANYSAFLHEPVELRQGKDKVDGVIKGLRLDDDGNVEFSVVIADGDIVRAGLEALRLKRGAAIVIDEVHPTKPSRPSANGRQQKDHPRDDHDEADDPNLDP